MTTEHLYNQVLNELGVTSVHPLHEAMLQECCETALANKQDLSDKTLLFLTVKIAFVTSNAMLKGLVNGALEYGDQVTLNYRGQTFNIPKDSKLLQN